MRPYATEEMYEWLLTRIIIRCGMVAVWQVVRYTRYEWIEGLLNFLT